VARGEHPGELLGLVGLVVMPFLAEAVDRPSALAVGEVLALGEQHEGIPLAQPRGQIADRLDEGVPAVRVVLDEPVRGAVEHDVGERVPLQLCQHHDARVPPVADHDGPDQHHRVPRTGVPAEHQDRPGPRDGAVLDPDLQSEQLPRGPVQARQPPSHERVMGLLDPGGPHAQAEPAGDPQDEQRDDAEGLECQVDDAERHDPGGLPAPSRGGQVDEEGREQQDR